MNFAQAKRALAKVFGAYALAASRKHWPNKEKYKVWVGQGEKSVLIGFGSTWEAAVGMAMLQAPDAAPPEDSMRPGYGTQSTEAIIATSNETVGTYMQSKEPTERDPGKK